MIPRSSTVCQAIPSTEVISWQDELSQMLTSAEALFDFLDLDRAYLEAAKRATRLFPLRCTRAFASRMQAGNIHDPLLRQILPLQLEELSPEGFTEDPLMEEGFVKSKGLIQKYQGRVLLMLSPHCAVNCRYCFRRHFDYQSNSPSRKEWQESLDHIRRDSSIREVILSGGDPLVVSDKHLLWMIEELEEITHVKTLRIHSRLPIVLPNRMTDTLIDAFTASHLRVVLVVHSNHAQEIDDSVETALKRVGNAGVSLLNQSVLLKGINDKCATLAALSERLFECGVMPYYLHSLDKVQGAAHFEVDEKTAKALHQDLRRILPGYLVPKFVKEVAGAHSKLPIG